MKTFQFILISLFATNANAYKEKRKKEIHIGAVLTIARGVFVSISSLVFAREAFGNVKTSNFVSKYSARIENFMS